MSFSQSNFYSEFSALSIHRKFYIIGLLILALGMPLSPILVSVSQFILFGTWLIEGNFKSKFLQIKSNLSLWAFLLLPLLHLLWLFNTTNFDYALHDLKIKIPLLLFPLVLGTIPPILAKELRWILYTFILGVLFGTFASFTVLVGIFPQEFNDIRDISIFISHIRFGLMILLSQLIIFYYLFNNSSPLTFWNKLGISILIIWLLSFLIILQSITSWIAFVLILFYAYITLYKKIQSFILKIASSALIIAVLLSCVSLISKVYYDFYFTKTLSLNNLPTHTPRGNAYLNDTTSIYKENGHYIYILICKEELAKTWPKLSEIPYSGKDANGFSIENTMIRYLTSKGLPKDQDGLLALEPEDIRMIEKGYATSVIRKKFIPYVKMYNVVWEIDRYMKSGDANNKSIVQRIEFGRAAKHIISKNFWFGIGTGDLNNAYTNAYIEIGSILNPKNQLRAHNQFLTFFVTFGVFGFFIALFSMFYPALKNYKKQGILLSGFLIMAFLSMFNEDTLETQAGVTFYIAFYTLFIFSEKE
jgi:hypothetical protein